MSVSPVTPDLTPTLPDSAPVAKIFTGAGVLKETVTLPCQDLTDKVFGKRHRISSSYSAGRHLVIYQWIISSVTYQQADVFDVIAGGDADGNVIGMEHLSQPAGRYLVYETEAGNVVSGLNPALVEG